MAAALAALFLCMAGLTRIETICEAVEKILNILEQARFLVARAFKQVVGFAYPRQSRGRSFLPAKANRTWLRNF